MSFSAQDLSVLAYANGFTHWHYRTCDPLLQLTGSYFAGARELLRPGDQLTATLLTDVGADLASFVVVSIDQSGGVELDLLARSGAVARRQAA